MSDVHVTVSQNGVAAPIPGNVRSRIRRVEVYLWWQGVVLFVILLGAGFVWLLCSDGIGKRSRSAFFCALLLQGLAVAWAAGKACVGLLGPVLPKVDAISQPIGPPDWPSSVLSFGLWMALVLIFGWPLLELLRPEVRAWFYEVDTPT